MMLLGCGSNGNYQLGNGNDDDQYQFTPGKFRVGSNLTSSLPSKPHKVVCGGNHTLIVFESGELYACGDNTYGQCGIDNDTLGDPSHIKVFTKVDGVWKNAACGWEFSVLIDVNNQIFVCGLGLKGELGLGKHITKTNLTKLESMCGVDVVDIKASLNLVIAKDVNGNYFGWGDSKKGQLIEKLILYEPKSVIFPISEIQDFQVTKNCLILSTKNSIRSIGKVPEGLSSTIQLNNIECVKAMWSSIHYKQGKSIRSFGNSRHGQKFPGSLDSEDFTFEVGSEHGLVYIRDRLYAWGWGEHGNCGLSDRPGHDQIIFDQLNHIYTGHIQLIAGGCATSWIVV